MRETRSLALPFPKDLTATLRHYQESGVDWLTVLRDAGLGALLADDMGLGKTIQALCVLRGRSLVVAPTSVVANWAQEIERFRPGLRTCVYHGPNRDLDADADITLTTYALLRIDIDKLSDVGWDVVRRPRTTTRTTASSRDRDPPCGRRGTHPVPAPRG